MTNSALRKINSALLDAGRHTVSQTRPVLFAAFILGLLFGSFVGICSGPGSFEPQLSDGSGNFSSAWMFFLLLLIFSTSYLGVALIPALMFVRGYLFSCSVAVLYYSLGTEGLLLSMLSSALPLCFLLPCYIVVGDDCFRLSRRLAELRLGRGGYCGVLFPLRHLLALLFMILWDSIYSAYILPALVSALI